MAGIDQSFIYEFLSTYQPILKPGENKQYVRSCSIMSIMYVNVMTFSPVS